MRIACIIDSLGSGGAQRQMVKLAKEFKKKGLLVEIFVYHAQNFYSEELKEANIPVNLYGASNPLKRIFVLRKAIRQFKPNGVLSFLQVPNLIAILAGFPIKSWKVVVGERSTDYSILKSFKRRFFRLLYVFADKVVANSYANIELVRKINPILAKDKTAVLYNMLDEDEWGNIQKKIDSKEFTLAIAASHQYNKNLKGLILGVSLLSILEKNRLRVMWYGDQRGDNSYKEGRALIDELNLTKIFNFKPATNHIKDEFCKANAIGLFSFREGLPNSICEGMMLSKVILASNVSDNSRFIKADYLCNPYSSKSIAELISKAMSLPISDIDQIGKQNRLKALDLFDSKKIVTSYLKFLGVTT